MNDSDKSGLLLGKQVAITEYYAPELLYPIPRSQGRESMGLGDAPGFFGKDVWHAYELSWLNADGKPCVAVARLSVPASSAALIESKSLKLYLHSLNSTRFDSESDYHGTVVTDLSAAAGAAVELQLYPLNDPAMRGQLPPGICIDSLSAGELAAEPHADILKSTGSDVTEQLHSNLLRSLCPVTGQPDWATLWVDYSGAQIERSSLLAYVLAFRRHQDFHEQCVERIYSDIHRVFQPRRLTVQAMYTRRGGLDICPLRSSYPDPVSLQRLDRQ
jgi:7-cyano-7-deazaguanine reductase